jgi:hypothetical protein
MRFNRGRVGVDLCGGPNLGPGLGKAGAHGLLGEEVANSACALCLLHCFCQFLGAVKPCTLTFESGALTNEPIGG